MEKLCGPASPSAPGNKQPLVAGVLEAPGQRMVGTLSGGASLLGRHLERGWTQRTAGSPETQVCTKPSWNSLRGACCPGGDVSVLLHQVSTQNPPRGPGHLPRAGPLPLHRGWGLWTDTCVPASQAPVTSSPLCTYWFCSPCPHGCPQPSLWVCLPPTRPPEPLPCSSGCER